MSKLLIDDYPIQVLPKLAKQIGLNEAIFLQQLHYWLNGKSSKVKNGKRWIYNTYDDWHKQFPFWSVSTIKRVITSLDNKKLLLKANYNQRGFDKTTWYSIDYERLNRVNQPLGQNEPIIGSKRTNPTGQNEPTNTIDYTETNLQGSSKGNPYQLYQECFGILNPINQEDITYWINDLGEELVIEAMKRAALDNKPYSWAVGMMKNWAKNNLTTLEDVEAFGKRYKNEKQQPPKRPKNNSVSF